MDTKKAQSALKRINQLFDKITGGNEAIANIEKDLLLGHIRDLYDALLTENTSSSKKEEERSVKKPELEVVNPNPKPSYTPPKIIEITEEEKEVPPKETPKEAPPVKEEREKKSVPPPVTTRQAQKVSGDFEQLFEHKKATELSEKLSERPISDLTRAMSINDKLLYVNELFDRDIEAFNETLKVLNRFDSLEDAKGLLSNLADRYVWLEENRLDIARDFIKLIRRRYNQ